MPDLELPKPPRLPPRPRNLLSAKPSAPIIVTAIFGRRRQDVVALSLKNQNPAVERAMPLCLVRPEFRRLDSMKTPTLSAGMGSANKYPWADPQPANANSWRWLGVSTPSAITLSSRLRASPMIVLTMA